MVAIQVWKKGAFNGPCNIHATRMGRCLWIEYRQPIPVVDAAMSGSHIGPLMFGGASLTLNSTVNNGQRCGPCIIHAHNGVGTTYDEQKYGFPLKPGESYVEQQTMTRVTVDSLTPEAMTVTVESL